MCFCLENDKHILEGFTDVDMAGDVESKKSTFEHLITYLGRVVLWQFKL